MRIKLGLVFALMILVALPAQAEDMTGRYGVGLETAAMKLVGGDYDYSDVNLNFALNLRYGLSPRFSLQAALKTGWTRPGVAAEGEDAGLEWTATRELYTTFWQTRAELIYHLGTGRAVTPYLGFGLGLSSFRVKDLTYKDFEWPFPGGPIVQGYDTDGNAEELDAIHFSGTLSAGLEWYVSSGFSLGLGVRYHLFPTNKLDNVGLSADDYVEGTGWGADNVDANTGLIELAFGMTWFFGSTDKDGDGFVDADDECPEAAEDFDGFQDTDGCPEPDNDGDGILDELDRCPDSPEDMDGFEDGDGCPEPDNDGDGIPDLKDHCPELPEDMDGFQDDDGCPDPDNDGDGVADAQDACPDTPAGVVVDAKGCPEVAEIKETLVLKGVNFKSGSAELTPESLGALNEVGRSLVAWPQVRVEIQGHTDSAGSASANEALSLKRAEAVRDHLVSLGVNIRRMRAVGYGERFPVASNSSPAGRAENRRVELHRIGK